MSEVLWLALEIGINMFQGFLVTWFINRTLTAKESRPPWAGLVCMLVFCASCSLYIFFELPIVDTWLFITPLMYSILCFQDNWKEKLFWNAVLIALFLGVTAMFNALITSVFGVDSAVLLEKTPFRIIFLLSVNLALTAALFIVSGRRHHKFGNIPSMVLFVVINLLVIVIIDLLYIIREKTGITVDNELLTIASMTLGIAIASIALYEIMSSYVERYHAAKQKEEEQRMALQRVEELKGIYASLHSLRHDMKNHVQIATMMLENGKSEESAAYLAQIENRMFSVFSTGCLALDSALTMKELEMRRAGIIFKYNLCSLESMPLTDFEMCTVIGNLLDNAIEAVQCAELSAAEKVISLRMYIVRQMLCIHCENPAQESHLHQENGKFLTTKKTPGHGLGISNIESTIRNTSGACRFSCENGVFRADISIPM